MRNLVHVSDLHFGRSDKSVVEGLFREMLAIRPDLVIISGDLTQRAHKSEFAEAHLFLERLKENGLRYFVIPGNHDIAPLYRPMERLLNPYKDYREHISQNTESFYSDDEIAIASINTVNRLTIESGSVAPEQLEAVHEWFSRFPETIVKIVVTHHPLHRNPRKFFRKPARHARGALMNLTFSGVDAYLSGHLHRTAFSRPGALSVHAGTVSERLRGEPASFNVISIELPHMIVEKRAWNESAGTFKKGRATALLIKNKFKEMKRRTQSVPKDASV